MYRTRLIVLTALLCLALLPYSGATRASDDLIQPAAFTYLGAFRLPDDGDRPLTFAYGGAAMTFNPDGDRTGTDDGFPGSLFIMGHDRLPYGELPDGNQIAEVSIPNPVIATTVGVLDRAIFIQPFQNVAAGFFTGLDELPRAGMLYLNTPATGPKIHLTWGQHLQPENETATHAWFDPTLARPNMQGLWYIGQQSPYSLTGYMFEIPQTWADQYVGSRYIATGRYRDGGWSGMGPALFAYRPWGLDSGMPAAPGTHLEEVALLAYAKSDSLTTIERGLNGYQHPDEWEGGAWLTTGDGRSAVLFAGTKAIGAKYWYGYVNPASNEIPCVEVELRDQFTLCRLANGAPCPETDLAGCANHNDYRGWWSTAFDAQIILYDPVDLARVAAEKMQSWEPQPYATISIDRVLFHNPAGVELQMLGQGVQRRYRIGEVAYDRQHGLLYILELFADEDKPVVHVWRII